MDNEAGAQFATKSHQTTIDLQAGIIAGHQDEIGRANVKLADQLAEIDRLNMVLADRQAKIAQLMGEAARAGMAAPAAPSEQAEPSELVTLESALAAISHLDQSNSPGRERDAREMLVEAAAPAAPLPAQPEQWKGLNDVRWMNIVNHDQAFDLYDKNDAVHAAVKMTEAKLKEINAAAGAAPLPELTGPSEALAALLARIDDAHESYERFGGICKFEGSPMISAATLEEIVALRGEYHVASSAAFPSPAPALTDTKGGMDIDDVIAELGIADEVAAIRSERLDAPTRTREPQDGLVPPLVAAPVSQHETIAGAVARGWCSPENESKVMDTDLALAITREVETMLASRCRAQGGDTKTSDAEFSPASRMGGITSKESAETAQPTEPKRIEITINGRQLRDALEAAWTERSDPDEGDTELTLFVRDKAEVSVEGEAMEPGLWFYWTDYPEEGVCFLDPNAPETVISESAETAAPGASIGDKK